MRCIRNIINLYSRDQAHRERDRTISNTVTTQHSSHNRLECNGSCEIVQSQEHHNRTMDIVYSLCQIS